MGPLIWRELVLVWRTSAFWAAMATYLTVLALFILIWGDGMPVPVWGTNWQQFNFIQRTFLMIALPWAAARCAATSNRDLVLLAMATGRLPSSLLVAKFLALATSLVALVLAALPFALLMQQIAARPVTAVAADLLPLVGLAMFVATVTPGYMLASDSPLRGWMASTVSTLAAGFVIPLSNVAMPVWAFLALAAATPTLLIADSRLRYLPEELL